MPHAQVLLPTRRRPAEEEKGGAEASVGLGTRAERLWSSVGVYCSHGQHNTCPTDSTGWGEEWDVAVGATKIAAILALCWSCWDHGLGIPQTWLPVLASRGTVGQ